MGKHIPYLFLRRFFYCLRELENAELENADFANKDLKNTDVAQTQKQPLLASVMNLSPLVRLFLFFSRSVAYVFEVCVFETPRIGYSFALSARQHHDELNAGNMKKGEISFTSMPSASLNHSLTLPTQFFFTLSNSSFLLADSTNLQPHFTSS